MTYNPQRLLRHCGFDQEAVWVSGENCIDVWDADSLLCGRASRLTAGELFLYFGFAWLRFSISKGTLHSMRCMGIFTKFVAPDSQEPPVFVVLVGSLQETCISSDKKLKGPNHIARRG